MKDMKIKLMKNLANTCINVGDSGSTTYSLFGYWYEPKISEILLKLNINNEINKLLEFLLKYNQKNKS